MSKSKKLPIKTELKSLKSDIEITKDFELKNQTVLLILTVLIGICYLKIWQNGIVWDDNQYVFNNDIVKNFDLKAIFTSFQIGNYHPITMLSLAIDYALAKDQKWIYHFENLVFHAINSFLVFRLFKKLQENTLVAIIVAILFAIHPLHVESVAWKAERKDLLFTFFLLISFLQYISFEKEKSLKFYIFSIIFFVLACLSKGMAVVLPALLIITDYVFLKKELSFKAIFNKIPYFIFTIIFSFISVKAQQEFGAVAGFLSDYYTFIDRVLLVTYSFCFYWIKSIFPINLIPFYPYPFKPLPYFYYLSILLVLALIFFIYKYRKTHQKYIWGILFFLISVSTVLQIIPVGSAITADRYSYLSSIGIFYVFALIISYLWKKFEFSKWVFVLLGLIFSSITFSQVSIWKNTFTLFDKALKLNPKSAIIHYNIAFYYTDIKDRKRAVYHFKQAEKNGLWHAPSFRTTASVYIDDAQYDEAIKTLDKIKKRSKYINKDFWLYGTAYYRKGDFGNAITNLKKASDAEPTNLEYLKDYGKALMDGRKIPEAISVFNKLFNSGKKDAEIYQLLGNCFIKTSDWQKGVEYWKKGSEMLSDGQFEYNIGIQYAIHGDLESTKDWYKKAAKKGNSEAVKILTKNGDSF